MPTLSAEHDLFGSIADLSSTIRDGGERAETDRDMPAEAIGALREHGFFRIWTPRALGGLELDPVTALQVFEDVAYVDASVGWIVANSAVITTFLQVLPDDGLEEIYADPDALIAGGWFPPGTAVAAEGGYRVSGQWAFGSGCRRAGWITGMSVILGEDGQPELGPDGGPRLLLFTVPFGEAEVVDHWNTLGMRGTGSHDVRLADVFVPARRVFVLGPFVSPGAAFTGPLYKFHMWLGGAVIAAVALGSARAALDGFTALAGQKTPSYTQKVLAIRPIIQDHVARAAASLGAGRAFLHRAVGDAYADFERGAPTEAAALAPVQLAACFAVEASARAVDLLQDVAGTSGIRVEDGLERHFRDVHTMAQHALASSARYESLGQLLLGQTSDWTFFYL
jgi:alkylation response protein AidB-like acyl-CoA dehydrogenase